MQITKHRENSTLILTISERLDTTTAPLLEAELTQSLTGVTELIFDFSSLEYISSAGLRILLSTQKTMNKQGKMVVRGANASICEIFKITGFSDILTIE